MRFFSRLRVVLEHCMKRLIFVPLAFLIAKGTKNRVRRLGDFFEEVFVVSLSDLFDGEFSIAIGAFADGFGKIIEH